MAQRNNIGCVFTFLAKAREPAHPSPCVCEPQCCMWVGDLQKTLQAENCLLMLLSAKPEVVFSQQSFLSSSMLLHSGEVGQVTHGSSTESRTDNNVRYYRLPFADKPETP